MVNGTYGMVVRRTQPTLTLLLKACHDFIIGFYMRSFARRFHVLLRCNCWLEIADGRTLRFRCLETLNAQSEL